MRWSAFVTDTYFAPDLSRFTSAEIRDMTRTDGEQEHWLSNYMLNTVLRGALATPTRQQIYNFLRRSHSAFADYDLARLKTQQFLADRERIRAYIAAIGHWEDFLGHVWQANEFLARAFLPETKRPLFQPGDGSVNQRLHALHSRAKHAADAILRGDFTGETPLCVWLTNDGLKSTDAWLTYGEAADELRSLAEWASAVQDPRTMREKMSAMAGEGPNH